MDILECCVDGGFLFGEVKHTFHLFLGTQFGVCSHIGGGHLLCDHAHDLFLCSVPFVHEVVQVVEQLEPDAAGVPEVVGVFLVLEAKVLGLGLTNSMMLLMPKLLRARAISSGRGFLTHRYLGRRRPCLSENSELK